MKEKNKNNPSIIKDVKIRPDLISEDKSLPTSKEKIGKQKIDNNINNNTRRANRVFIYCLITFLIIFIFASVILSYLYYSLKIEIRNSKLASCNSCCAIENCKKSIEDELNNVCIECNSGFIPIYKNNKIISCLKCNIGYHLINDECILDYTFKAIYKSDGSNIQLINSNTSEIIEMTVDGKKVSSSNNYSFNDKQNHEVIMLLDLPQNLSSTFKGIVNMISISFNPLLNTSNIIDMNYMFYNCSSLKLIDFSNFDTSKVSKMQYMFYNCYSLISVGLSKFDTLNVEAMHFMFFNCSSLTSINLYNFKTSKVEDMNSMFYNCSLLASIDLSNFDTSQVTDMGSMFKGCSSLETINLANFKTPKLNLMDSMFFGCFSLASISLSSFNTSNVVIIDYLFYNCSSLTSIDLSKFDTSNTKIFDFMFYNCSSLTSIDLSNFDNSQVTHMDGMFHGCSRLEYINILNFRDHYRLSTINVDLFDKNIPLSGKIIANENFLKKVDKTYISGWDKIPS